MKVALEGRKNYEKLTHTTQTHTHTHKDIHVYIYIYIDVDKEMSKKIQFTLKYYKSVWTAKNVNV